MGANDKREATFHGAAISTQRWIEAIVFDQGLTAGQVRTALAVATYVTSLGNETFPGQEALAERLGITSRAIRKQLTALESKGWVALIRRGRYEGTEPRYSAYALTLPKKAE